MEQCQVVFESFLFSLVSFLLFHEFLESLFFDLVDLLVVLSLEFDVDHLLVFELQSEVFYELSEAFFLSLICGSSFFEERFVSFGFIAKCSSFYGFGLNYFCVS